MRDTDTVSDGADVVLGEDWVDPQSSVDVELRDSRRRRKAISVNRSPLARKIITFNLLGLVVLVAGVLYLNPVRDSLVAQRERALVSTAELLAEVFVVQQSVGIAPSDPGTSPDATDAPDTQPEADGGLTPELVRDILAEPISTTAATSSSSMPRVRCWARTKAFHGPTARRSSGWKATNDPPSSPISSRRCGRPLRA